MIAKELKTMAKRRFLDTDDLPIGLERHESSTIFEVSTFNLFQSPSATSQLQALWWVLRISATGQPSDGQALSSLRQCGSLID